MSRLTPLLLAAFAFGRAQLAGADGAIYACANAKGHVRLIMTSPPTCRATETPLSWSQVGPQGPAGPQGPQGQPGPGMAVKDSNGALVGAYLREGGSEFALRTVAGTAIVIPIAAAQGSLSPVFLHMRADCSDTPLLNPNGAGPRYSMTTYGYIGGSKVYYPTGPETTVTNPPAVSYVGMTPTTCAGIGTFIPPDRCCHQITYCTGCSDTSPGAPFAVVDLGVNLVPPFHVEGP